MNRNGNFKIRGLLLGICVFVIATVLYAGTSKEYAMVYFKFGPEDLKIKVFADNDDLTEESHTDYIISQIKNSQCKLYLVKKFPNERALVHYRYRVIFYKPQNIGGNNYDVPIYSFKISFSGEDVVVEYPPSKAVPAEIKKNNLKKSFHRTPGSNIYYLKDYTGGDFALYDRMRRVTFRGFIKNANHTYTKMNNNIGVKVRLTKLNLTTSSGISNVTDREREINTIDVPLNEEIVVGMVPYKLSSPSDKDRYQLKFLRVEESESPIKIIHFGEVWDNLYEQALIYQDDDYYMDVHFDDHVYELEYGIGEVGGEIKRVEKSPLTIFLKDYDKQLLQFKLMAKAYAARYLEEPAPVIQLKVNASKRASLTVKDLALAHPNDVLVRDDGQAMILPRYKKTMFSIFTEPEGARVRIKRIDPVSGTDKPAFKVVGQSPVFFDQFEDGRYVIAADWFEKGAYDLGVRTETREVKIELSDSPNPELTKAIHWIKKQDTSMPYVLLKYHSGDSSDETDGFRVDPVLPVLQTNSEESNNKMDLEVTNGVLKVSNEISNESEVSTNNKMDLEVTNEVLKVSNEISNKVKKEVRNLAEDEKAELNISDDFQALEETKFVVKAHSILKGPETLYYVQIAAFQFPAEKLKINSFLTKKVWGRESFNRVFDRDEAWGAWKFVKHRRYVVLVVGAFSKSEAMVARQELLKWFPGSFVISDRDLTPIKTFAR